MSQTRRKLATEYLNLHFVTTLYHILCGKSFYFLRLAHSYFASAYYVQAFSVPIAFNQVGNRQYFQLVEKKKWFAWEHAKKVVEGLGTGWFVTVINLGRHSCGCGKILPRK